MKTSIALLLNAACLCAPLAHAQSTETPTEPAIAAPAESNTGATPAEPAAAPAPEPATASTADSAAGAAAAPVTEAATADATATSADDDDTAKAGGLGLKLGTDGFGVQYVYGLNRYIGLRAAYQFGAYNYDDEQDGTTYKSELKINAAAGFIDIMPFGGGFRVSAGVYSKTPQLTMRAQGNDQYDFGDGVYNGDMQVHAATDLGGAAPYLGIGWGGTANDTGFGLSFDLGVIFGKSPKVAAQASGVACDASVDASCDPHGPSGFDVATDTGFQADFEQERLKLEKHVEDAHFWPVLNIGLHYRF